MLLPAADGLRQDDIMRRARSFHTLIWFGLAAYLAHVSLGPGVAAGWRVAGLWGALALGLLALTYALGRPGLLGKQAGGSRSFAATALLLPYLALNGATLALVRLLSSEPGCDEIVPGLWLGRRLSKREALALRPRPRSVLDLTAEFTEEPAMLREAAYRCIPLLDGTAPEPRALLGGARWIRDQLEQGPVYVHCAMGHGRSALFVAAYLLLVGRAGTVDAALAEISGRRPGVHLHPDQSLCLLQFLHVVPEDAAG